MFDNENFFNCFNQSLKVMTKKKSDYITITSQSIGY